MIAKLPHIYQRLIRAYGPQHWWPGDTPFEIAIGAILTQNTAWTNVEKAIQNLKKAKVLSFGRMRATPERKLAKLIRPSGFFNQKSKRLKNFLNILFKEYGSLGRFLRIPLKTARLRLLKIHGIGPETADSILLYAGNKPTFVIDAYTRRIFTRLGLKKAHTWGYGELQGHFQANLPKHPKLYNEYHALIVQHAKTHCRTKPLCDGCPLQKTCRYGLTNHVNPD